MTFQDNIQEATQRLVKAYDPLEVYVYGSYVKDTPDNDDDLNLLVIIESSNKKVHQRSDLAFNALLSLEVPTNVTVFTKQEFDTFIQDVTSLSYEVKNKGKKVYARS